MIELAFLIALVQDPADEPTAAVGRRHFIIAITRSASSRDSKTKSQVNPSGRMTSKTRDPS